MQRYLILKNQRFSKNTLFGSIVFLVKKKNKRVDNENNHGKNQNITTKKGPGYKFSM